MASTITANMSTIKSKASELRSLNKKLKKQIESLVSTEKTLNSMWDGEANDAFHKAFSKDTTQMNNFYNAIEKYASSLEQIVEAYNKAEKANLNTASKRTY
ncbi:MAG: WXG100 family type VII secretion target [Lachnospiraceae bacterium]